jgi:hypothetical protein
MNLYRISQEQKNDYDTYDSAVVAAETESKAKRIHPSGDNDDWGKWQSWCDAPEAVTAVLIGVATNGTKAGAVICASFNAG